MTTPRIVDLVPHSGAMCLLERVVEWSDEHVVTATTTHRALSNPLANAGRLRAVHLCEYGAQAMAVHGGLCAATRGTRAEPGLLVALRGVELHLEFIEDLPGELFVRAARQHASEQAWQYTFDVRHGDRLLAAGRATIVMAAREPTAERSRSSPELPPE